MARILIAHSDRSARKHLEAYAAVHHQVTVAANAGHALKVIAAKKPDLILAGFDSHRREALEILRTLRQQRIHIPTIVLAAGGAGVYQAQVMSAGASEFLEYPIEPAALDQAISKVLQRSRDDYGQQPAISEEEAGANLTAMEKDLNRRMVCVAGKNQVYLQSFILGGGQKSKPRIALKCPLRKEFGDPPNVYYEYIRDVCCKDPSVCSAYQQWRERVVL